MYTLSSSSICISITRGWSRNAHPPTIRSKKTAHPPPSTTAPGDRPGNAPPRTVMRVRWSPAKTLLADPHLHPFIFIPRAGTPIKRARRWFSCDPHLSHVVLVIGVPRAIRHMRGQGLVAWGVRGRTNNESFRDGDSVG